MVIRAVKGRSRKGGAAGADLATGNAVEQEEAMASQEKSVDNGGTTQTKAGKLDLASKPEANGRSESGLTLRGQEEAPASRGAIEIAGLRPIGSSDIEVYATILNGRPIEASHLHIHDYSLPGHRPVFESELAIREDLTLPGGRPVMVSDPSLLQDSGLPGGRPIASNDLGDGAMLMGFLD